MITRKIPRNLWNIVINMNIMRLVILLELKEMKMRTKTTKSINVRSNEEAIVIAAESQSPKTTKEYGGLRSVQCGGTRQPSQQSVLKVPA